MANESDKNSKPQDVLQDLDAQGDPTGGRKAGADQQEYMIIKMENVIVTSTPSS